MSNYWSKSISMLSEETMQDLLTEVYENRGWKVKNMHRIDPRAENGADLEVRKDSELILIAVKDKPRTSDINQLQRLSLRNNEAKLIYVHSKPSTGGFAKEADRLQTKIMFLTGRDLHDFLIEGESVSYLQIAFRVHPLIAEYSDTLSIIWSCRKVKGFKESSRLDFENLYSFKKVIVKKRASVGVFALKFDDYVNSLLSIKVDEFPKILDNVFQDLDIVQRFAGFSLLDTVIEISNTTPHLLAHLWMLVSKRTYWNQYTLATDQMSSLEEVSDFTKKNWILPGLNAVGEAKNLSGNAIGFLSGVRDILENLSRSFRDLDVAIDWVWRDTPMKLPE